MAINATIATNTILSSANAYLQDSTVTTSTTGDVIVTAMNTSTLEATSLQATTTGDTAYGVLLAFNTVGWQQSNILFNTLDALLGDPLISEAFDGEQPAVDPGLHHRFDR